MKKLLFAVFMSIILGNSATYSQSAAANKEKQISPMTGIILSKEQRAAFIALNTDINNRIQKVKENFSGPERNAKFQELRQEQKIKREAIFTAEQNSQYNKNIREIREQRAIKEKNKKE